MERNIWKLRCVQLSYNNCWVSAFVVCKHQTYFIVLPPNERDKYLGIKVLSLNFFSWHDSPQVGLGLLIHEVGFF